MPIVKIQIKQKASLRRVKKKKEVNHCKAIILQFLKNKLKKKRSYSFLLPFITQQLPTPSNY